MLLSLMRVFGVAVLFLPFHAVASTTTLNSSVRALGMGDAHIAVADDYTSFFYNPAGLVKVSGFNWRIIGVSATGSGVSSYSKLTDLNTTNTTAFADALDDLYGDNITVGAQAQSIFTMPLFGFGVYNHSSAVIRVDNPVYPEIGATFLNDHVYTVGAGLPLSPLLHLGMALKYVKRTGSDTPLGPADVADLDTDKILSNYTQWGKGYGLDLGATINLPAPFFSASFSGVWRNVGQMRFRSENNSDIPMEDNDISMGLGLNFDLPLISISPAVDFRYLTNDDLQLTRKINFGVEIGLPLIDLRGGFREGYYTAGAGIGLGLIRADVATYGVELGSYPGQIEDRRYMVEVAFELGFGSFTAPGSGVKSKGSSSGGSSGSGSSSKSNSVWGGRRLKQRR